MRMRPGRTASIAGPGERPRAGSVSSSGPSRTAAMSPATATTSQSNMLASPMKSATNVLGRRVVELAGRAVLGDPGVVHDDDAVGDGERLLLVVRDIDDGQAELGLDVADLLADVAPELGVEIATAARRRAAPAARAPAPWPPRRAAAGLPRAGWAAARRNRPGRPARARHRRRSAISFLAKPEKRSPYSTFSRTVMCGNSA